MIVSFSGGAGQPGPVFKSNSFIVKSRVKCDLFVKLITGLLPDLKQKLSGYMKQTKSPKKLKNR